MQEPPRVAGGRGARAAGYNRVPAAIRAWLYPWQSISSLPSICRSSPSGRHYWTKIAAGGPPAPSHRCHARHPHTAHESSVGGSRQRHGGPHRCPCAAPRALPFCRYARSHSRSSWMFLVGRVKRYTLWTVAGYTPHKIGVITLGTDLRPSGPQDFTVCCKAHLWT